MTTTKAGRALPGYRDPRYSGAYESPGLIHRATVLAITERSTPE